jgi:hypothetical protein
MVILWIFMETSGEGTGAFVDFGMLSCLNSGVRKADHALPCFCRFLFCLLTDRLAACLLHLFLFRQISAGFLLS